MKDGIFLPTDILIPASADMTKWSVIACDQFSSEPEYWEEVERVVGSAPSTLRMMLPEVYLRKGEDDSAAAEERSRAMEEYIAAGVFETLRDCYVYVERTLPSGKVRRGLVGAVDLDEYDFHPGTSAPIRATEATDIRRLPPRIEIRRRAALEMPHISMFISDAEDRVLGQIMSCKDTFRKLYDFELMCDGGHIRAWQISGEDAEKVLSVLETLPGEAKMIIGDGNHSLAAAKRFWEEVKKTLPEEQWACCPAKYALAEVNNVFDPALDFASIHRLVTGIDPIALADFLEERFSDGSDMRLVRYGGQERRIAVNGVTAAEKIEKIQNAIDDYVGIYGGSIDYIHDDEELFMLADEEESLGIFMPHPEREELFVTAEEGHIFPKKSFSVGCAHDKRYYLECRALRK